MDIFKAIHNHKTKQIKTWLRKNSDLVNKKRDGEYPLHAASEYGYIDVIQLLLSHQAKVDSKDTNGWTPLFMACNYDHFEAMLELLDHGADPTYRCNHGDTILHTASRNGNVRIIQYLFNFHIDINAKNNDGWTPLHRASYSGKTEAVMLLMTEEADTSLLTNNGKTAHDFATNLRNFELADILSRYGYIQSQKFEKDIETSSNTDKISKIWSFKLLSPNPFRKKETERELKPEPITIRLSEVSHPVANSDENNANSLKSFFETKKGRFSDMLKKSNEQQQQQGQSTQQQQQQQQQQQLVSVREAVAKKHEHDIKESIKKSTKLFYNFSTDVTKMFKAKNENENTETNVETQTDDLPEETVDKKSAIDDSEHECPVCYDIMLPPVHIYQCVNGHVYCGNCKIMPNMNKCPQCGINITGLDNRNRYAEENIAKIYENEKE